jgi:heme exporter protein CcmD
MQHANFIIASYSVAALVLTALIAWVVFDYRALTRTLAGYEQQGVQRGSRRKKKS